uniref:Uncharacterized protein n=1 Tax=viral metagenome TaxID=1070528 RepID=A0A6H2A6J6_9ZZZZ
MGANNNMIGANDYIVSKIIKFRDPVCVLHLTGCTHYTNDPMHVFGRGNMATRWDLNCIYGGCRSCHSYIDTHPDEKEIYFSRIMEKESYNKAKKLSNTNVKYLPSDLNEINLKLKKIFNDITSSHKI